MNGCKFKIDLGKKLKLKNFGWARNMRNGVTSANVDPVNFYCTNQKTYKIKEKEVALVQGTNIPLWVVANLKRFGNCYISKMKYNLIELGHIVGFRITFTRCMETSGYILVKEDSR